MNTNSGHDPMLSSIIGDWGKSNGVSSATAGPAPSLTLSQTKTSSFIAHAAGLLSPERHSDLCDLTSLWSHERKRVMSIKMEDEDSFSSYSVAEDVDSGDIGVDNGDICIDSGDIDVDNGDMCIDNGDIDVDNGDIDMGVESSRTVIDIKSEIQDVEYGDGIVITPEDSQEYKQETNKFHMSEAEARRYIEEQFAHIAFFPRSDLSQREKTEYILARSDCSEFSVQEILNFDKKCPESARACAKIVQNIPQRYRWECVQPEDIPCCYTIVADCKKVSNRDKPPRPMNAFMIWAQGARRLINELCPKMQNALISEALGYYWRQKSDAFKLSFEQEKMKLRRFHNVEFPEYKYKPKTKVQKAKEKQELFLTKAKMRASVKLEKLRRTEETNLRRTYTKSSRPKKSKLDPAVTDKCKLPCPQILMYEPAAQTPPTKPAIKDMLTLKILNDKRCKEASNLFNPQECVLSSFGQLSPAQVDNSGTGDALDDPSDLDTDGYLEKDTSSKVMSSSVFDTPANTPPVEDDVEHHLHHQQTSSATTCSATACSRSATPTSSSSAPSSQTLIKSAQTVQILPVRTMSSVRPDLLDLISRQNALSIKQPSSATPTKLTDFTDLLFTYVTEALAPDQTTTYSITTKYSSSSSSDIDANNNNSDLNNNYNSDINNNNTDQTTTSLGSRTSKLILSPNEQCDLDTLFLDLSVPVLSDDDLRSLMNTL